MLINPISKTVIKPQNTGTINTLSSFTNIKSPQNNMNLATPNYSNSNHQNTGTYSNKNLDCHSGSSRDIVPVKISPRKLGTPNKISSTLAHNVYKSEYIHDAIHKGKILANSHSPHTRRSNPNTCSNLSGISNNKSTTKRSDHILIKEKLLQREEELNFDNYRNLYCSTPSSTSNIHYASGKSDKKQHPQPQNTNLNANYIASTQGHGNKNNLRKDLQLLQEEQEMENELSENDVLIECGNVLPFQPNFLQQQQSLQGHQQQSLQPQKNLCYNNITTAAKKINQQQNIKEQDHNSTAKNLFNQTYKEIGRENMSSSTKHTLTNVTNECQVQAQQVHKAQSKKRMVDSRKEANFSYKYGCFRPTTSNLHSYHSSASVHKQQRKSNSPGMKTRSPNFTSDGGGSFGFGNKSHLKSISKDSQSLKMLETVFNFANYENGKKEPRKKKQNPPSQRSPNANSLYEKAQAKI